MTTETTETQSCELCDGDHHGEPRPAAGTLTARGMDGGMIRREAAACAVCIAEADEAKAWADSPDALRGFDYA